MATAPVEAKLETSYDVRLTLRKRTVDHDGYCSDADCESVEEFTNVTVKMPRALCTRTYHLGEELAEDVFHYFTHHHNIREDLSSGSGYCSYAPCWSEVGPHESHQVITAAEVIAVDKIPSKYPFGHYYGDEIIVPRLVPSKPADVTVHRWLERVTLVDSQYPNLSALVRENREIRVSVYDFVIGRSMCDSGHLVMCHGFNDRTLIRLANDCHMPRGFPIVVLPTGIYVYGFYPKFANDDRNADADDLGLDLSSIATVRGTLKYSGFLGGVIPFQYQDDTYVIYTSKNSANRDSPFVQDVRRLFNASPGSQSAIQEMAREGTYLYAEVLSFTDQTHGYALRQEAAIVTLQGRTRYIPAVAVASAGADTHPFNFVGYLSSVATTDFCHKYDLARDGYFFTDHPAELLIALQRERDFLTYSKFMAIVKDCWVPGTISHDQCIQSDILEGLVLQITKAADAGTIVPATAAPALVKFKLPAYTIRTMLYRPFLQEGLWDVERFVRHWCVSAPGRDYWSRMAQAFLELESTTEISPDEPVARHIYIADRIKSVTGPDMTLSGETAAAVTLNPVSSGLARIARLTVIMVLGPIGSGKSTCGEYLSSIIPGAVHIDGDAPSPYVTADQTMQLGKERNPYSVWCVVRTLLRGRIPVVSAGGGAFSDLPATLMKMLRIPVQIILYLPERVGPAAPAAATASGIDFNALYSSPETRLAVQAAITERIQRGVWNVPAARKTRADGAPDLREHLAKIAQASASNQKFAEEFAAIAVEVCRFLYLNSDNYSERDLPNQIRLPSTPIRNIDERGDLIAKWVHVQQVRLLAPGLGHETQVFNRHGVRMTLREVESYQAKCRQPIEGRRVTTAPVAGPRPVGGHKVVSLVHPCVLDASCRHITLNPGAHKPAEMRNLTQAIWADIPEVTIDGLVYNVQQAKTTSVPVIYSFVDVFVL